MAYHSLFEHLRDDYRLQGWEQMRYSGFLEDVLSGLEALAEKPGWTIEDHANLVLHPSRIIRAVVDYKIANPELQLEEAVRGAIAFALSVYTEPRDLPAKTRAFREYATGLTNGTIPLLSTTVIQPYDIVTWDVCSPELSQAAAVQLARKTGDDDILFIALGHGGVAAGIDVYLRAADRTHYKKSIFYTVRFSTAKMDDRTPQVSAREKDFLREASDGRAIVLFDEDVSTGDTMRTAYEFFSDLFENENIILLTNKDISGELEKLKEKINGGENKMSEL